MEIISKIVVRKLAIMLMVIVFPKLYPACQTDDNGITPGSNLTLDDKRVVAEPTKAESLGIHVKQSECEV